MFGTLFPGRSTQALESVGAQEGVCCELTIDVHKGGRRGKNERECERERESKRERMPNVSRTTRTVVLIFTFYIMTSSLKTFTHVSKLNFHYCTV